MTLKKYLFATNNKNKYEEINKMLPSAIQLTTLNEVGFQGEIPEDGETLHDNALQKAKFLFDKLGIPCFADDTGLEVEALDKRPGVYSARYAAMQLNKPSIAGDASENIKQLLKQMQGETNRKAQFKTVICLIEDDRPLFFEGSVKGVITQTPSGNKGFGYDPVFIPENHSITFAEMPLTEKNTISHRYRAFKKLIEYLNNTISLETST